MTDNLSTPKIDIRQNYSTINTSKGPSFRSLNPLEYKKLARLEKEEDKILEIHTDLIEQEQIFRNSLDKNIELLNNIELKTKLMDYQIYGVSWMKNRENSIVQGGILADEMGMGKTLQALGLISTDKKLTLVIAPAVALNQWMSEIEKHAPDLIAVSYYGRSKNDFDNSVNIILTTYGTVESEYRRKNGILFDKEFYRIILDEAHSIKDSKGNTSNAISYLKAKKRWGLTGTPVQNRVGDLYSLVKFLKLDPHAYYFCKKCPCKTNIWLNYKKDNGVRRGFCTCGHFGASHFGWWNRRITSQIKEFGYTEKGREIFDNLNKITSHIILRRTKNNLEKELGLPSKVVSVIRNYFSEQERDFYTSLYKETKTKFDSYAVQGQVNNNYAHIFELLQKMRLAVNHPYLAMKHGNDGVPICGYCNEEADDPIISKCKHIFCREEARIFLQQNSSCPVCKVRITIDLNQTEDFSYKSRIHMTNWTSSSKIECLMEELTMLKSKTNCTKSLVFSQFVNFLELLRWRLERAGFRCVHIYGSMPISQRKAAIEAFNSNKDITVFLISLKAGGVALNLTEATRVFLMDLWWNPAVEEQAMDRIHRIGQYRPIRISRIIVQDSIESRILALQNKKKALFESAVDNDISALERLNEEDLMFLFS